MKTDFTIRRATIDNMWDIYELANSPEVRTVSVHTDPISREEHQKWYTEKLGSLNSRILTISNNEQKFIGTIRFDLSAPREYTITIYLIKKSRGLGIGTRLIQTVTRDMINEYPGYTIKADILENNLGSVQVFKKAGFLLVGNQIINGKNFLELKYYKKE